MFDKELFSLLWVIVCVVLVIGLAYWFTKHVVGKGGFRFLGGNQQTDAIRVVSRTAVGKDQQLLLVESGGATTAGISLVAEFTAEEAQKWDKPAPPQNGEQPPSFTEALQTVIKQRIKR